VLPSNNWIQQPLRFFRQLALDEAADSHSTRPLERLFKCGFGGKQIRVEFQKRGVSVEVEVI
jgi:hypothetical protein